MHPHSETTQNRSALNLDGRRETGSCFRRAVISVAWKAFCGHKSCFCGHIGAAKQNEHGRCVAAPTDRAVLSFKRNNMWVLPLEISEFFAWFVLHWQFLCLNWVVTGECFDVWNFN